MPSVQLLKPQSLCVGLCSICQLQGSPGHPSAAWGNTELEASLVTGSSTRGRFILLVAAGLKKTIWRREGLVLGAKLAFPILP